MVTRERYILHTRAAPALSGCICFPAGRNTVANQNGINYPRRLPRRYNVYTLSVCCPSTVQCTGRAPNVQRHARTRPLRPRPFLGNLPDRWTCEVRLEGYILPPQCPCERLKLHVAVLENPTRVHAGRNRSLSI